MARLRGYTDCAQLLEETERGYWLYQARKLYDDKATLAALPRYVCMDGASPHDWMMMCMYIRTTTQRTSF